MWSYFSLFSTLVALWQLSVADGELLEWQYRLFRPVQTFFFSLHIFLPQFASSLYLAVESKAYSAFLRSVWESNNWQAEEGKSPCPFSQTHKANSKRPYSSYVYMQTVSRCVYLLQDFRGSVTLHLTEQRMWETPVTSTEVLIYDITLPDSQLG